MLRRPVKFQHATTVKYWLPIVVCISLLFIFSTGLRKSKSIFSGNTATILSQSIDFLSPYPSCVAKVRSTLNKAIKLNQKFRAIAEFVTEEIALREAARLDQIPVNSRGRLHCAIIAVKDNIETSTSRWGLSTAAGSAPLKELLSRVSMESAPTIARLEKEGVIILGKANMDDFALQYHSFSTRAGQTLNCHDPDRFPGGSSGGSAVAVSTQMVDFALGTDTGGSIRIPSSFGGIVGLRPAINRISTRGVIPLSKSRDTIGPICANVQTCKLAFEVMMGGENNKSKAITSFCVVSAVQSSFKVGIIRDLFTEDSWFDLKDAIQVLQSKFDARIIQDGVPESMARNKLMKQTKSASMYEFERDVEAYLVSRLTKMDDFKDLEMITSETKEKCNELNQPAACDQVVESLEKKLKTAGTIPNSVVGLWRSTREEVLEFMQRENLDAIAFPAFTALPTRIKLGKKQEFCPNNRLAAITGLASLVVHGGKSMKMAHLPVGLELLGPDECVLLAIGEKFEKDFGRNGACAVS